MTRPTIGLGPRSQNMTPLEPEQVPEAFVQATPMPPPMPFVGPPNKFAPTGWRKKVSVEFDLQMPSGQWARVRRLERNDLFKLRIIDHLDNLLPELLDIGDDEQRETKIMEALKNNMNLVDDMYNVIDVIVLACCVRPVVVNNKELVNYGEEIDPATGRPAYENEDFTATVHIDDVDIEDKQFIFANAFRQDADSLKSVPQPESSVELVPAISGVQLPTEPVSGPAGSGGVHTG